MKKIFLPAVLLLSIFSFLLMLKPGIFSTQDFHFFRLVEFDRCIQDLQIPCRWSSESGLGYGEPLFNFYGQLAYIPSEIVHLLGFSFIDSFKFGFIFSVFGSAITMYFLARKLWKNDFAALISSVFYVYAPYRAVDIWVRGALPESMAFILFPLILLKLDDYFDSKNIRDLILFSLSVAALILTHNLSVVLFAPVIIIWLIFRQYKKIDPKAIKGLVISALLIAGIAAFYLLPAALESKYVDIASTTTGYFDFRGHFVTLSQLFFSRFWGYGGSVFGPEDGLSLSIGHLQWIVAAIALVVAYISRKLNAKLFVLISIAIFSLFLTHNKSTFLWISLPFMKYIQFPWRFLAPALFSLSLLSGYIAVVFSKQKILLAGILISFVVLINFNFFRPDIWYKTSDIELITGERWIEQTRASIGDFWPKDAGPIPSEYAPKESDEFKLIEKKSNLLVYETKSDQLITNFPVNDFPGWEKIIHENRAVFVFKNTIVRTVGNVISVITLIGVGVYLIKSKKYAK